MVVSAQISIYPLRQSRLTPAVEAVGVVLAAHGLKSVVGPISTVVVGEDLDIFAASREAFATAAEAGHRPGASS